MASVKQLNFREVSDVPFEPGHFFEINRREREQQLVIDERATRGRASGGRRGKSCTARGRRGGATTKRKRGKEDDSAVTETGEESYGRGRGKKRSDGGTERGRRNGSTAARGRGRRRREHTDIESRYERLCEDRQLHLSRSIDF
ncbi:uncharacterized protein LOC144360306 [Saccoglossus kowalevskii]